MTKKKLYAVKQKLEEDLNAYLPHLTEEDQNAMLHLFHASFRRTDSKRVSANKLYSETIINMIKDVEPVVVCNGREWRRYTSVDACILPPTTIRGDGACERVVPQDCLNFSKGYSADVFAFIKEEIFLMQCGDGDVHFDTRQEQQSKRRIAIEAASNEGISSMNLYDGVAVAATAIDAAANGSERTNKQADEHTISTTFSPETHTTPSHLLSKAELIAKYGQLLQSHLYPYVKLFDLHVLLKSMLDNMSDGLGIEYNECMLDDGGNFITNSGVEKILMFRHALTPNIPLTQFKRNQRQTQYH